MMIDGELDEALGRQAAAEGVSKAELLRRYARVRMEPLPPIHEDPLWALVGSVDADPVEDIDEFLYGPIGDG